MYPKFQPGSTAYIIESAIFIKKVKILKYSDGFYTVQLEHTKGAFRVRESRLYLTEEEAKKNKRG